MRRTLYVVLAAAGLYGCGKSPVDPIVDPQDTIVKPPPPSPAVKSISFSATKFPLVVGETGALAPVVTWTNGRDSLPADARWVSTNPSAAIVEGGVIVTKGEGVTTISLAVDTVYREALVFVFAPAATFDQASVTECPTQVEVELITKMFEFDWGGDPYKDLRPCGDLTPLQSQTIRTLTMLARMRLLGQSWQWKQDSEPVVNFLVRDDKGGYLRGFEFQDDIPCKDFGNWPWIRYGTICPPGRVELASPSWADDADPLAMAILVLGRFLHERRHFTHSHKCGGGRDSNYSDMGGWSVEYDFLTAASQLPWIQMTIRGRQKVSMTAEYIKNNMFCGDKPVP